MTTRSLTALAASAGLAVLTAGGSAAAQPTPEGRAAAAALFEDGRRLKQEGKLAEACPKLEESQHLDPGIGTLYHLADCFEQIGRTASAWLGFRDAATMASAAGRADQEKAARARVAALEVKLTRLNIVLKPEAGVVEVRRDGGLVAPALLGTAVPLDPGKHTVSATAPGKEPWEVTVVLDQPGAVVRVEVPALTPKIAVVPPPPADRGTIQPPPFENGARPPQPPPPDASSPRPWQMPLGVALTAMGAVGLGAGTAFGFVAKATYVTSNANGHCDATGCDGTGLRLRNNALGQAALGTGLFIAGAVLAAGGIVVWVTAPASKGKAAAGRSPAIGLGLGPAGAAIRGAW